MSRSCQSGTFSRPTTAAARTTRARPQMRSATFGLRLCGIADEPFIPARTAPRPRAPRCGRGGGSRSRTGRATSRRARARTSSSAWRSRAITCVESGSGSRPSRSQAMRSTSGSSAAYVPTVPESWPTRFASSARASRVAVAVELERPAGELPAERRRLGVDAVRAADADRAAVLLGAAHDGVERAVEPGEDQLRRRPGSAARARCRRRPRRSGRSAPSGPPGRAARRRRRRTRRCRGRSSARSRRRARRVGGDRALRGSPRRPRPGRRRARPSASSAASSTSSQRASLPSSDQIRLISGRE